jgi:hypothetical protein
MRLDDYDDPEDLQHLVCDFAGHDWQDAGGGLLICSVCEEEMWDEAPDPPNDGGWW